MAGEELLWSELTLNAPRLASRFRRRKTLILADLSHVLVPHIHEQKIQPYGVVIARYPIEPDALGSDINGDIAPCDLPEDTARSAADGYRTFLIRGTTSQLLTVDRPLTVTNAIDLVSDADGLLLRVDEAGTAQLIHGDGLVEIRGRAWQFRESLQDLRSFIRTFIPKADTTALYALVSMAYYVLGPEHAATTLVYCMAEHECEPNNRRPGERVSSLSLKSQNPLDQSRIAHLARYRDGALVFDRSGHLLEIGSFLTASAHSVARIEQIRGTRHTSAARHSYDCPENIVIVVSEDGPVTIFSDGGVLRSLAVEDPAEQIRRFNRVFPHAAGDLDVSISKTQCGSCKVQLLVRRETIQGWKDIETANCPECGNEVERAKCFSIQAHVIKTGLTVEMQRKRRTGESGS